jgi:hypothetical protein
LVRAGGVVRERMALVAADHLAEVLLQDHMEETFVATESMGPLTPRRYDRQQRRRLVADFSARVELACGPPIGFSKSQPLLDAPDASVFRVAHAYRNSLYHGDRHNPALGRSLAIVYLQAVGHTLVRSWPEGLIIGPAAGARDRNVRALRRLGASWSGRSYSPRAAADESVRQIVGRLRVQRATLCRQLIADLEQRARAAQATLDSLSAQGLPREALRDLVRAALLWAAYRADPELVRLQDEYDAIIRDRIERSQSLTDEEAAAYLENEEAQERRRDALREGFRAPVTVDTARRLPRAAAKLHRAQDIPLLLERYQVLDERLRLLEQAVEWGDLEVDRLVHHELDVARGK